MQAKPSSVSLMHISRKPGGGSGLIQLPGDISMYALGDSRRLTKAPRASGMCTLCRGPA